MKKSEAGSVIEDELITNKIYIIRGQKVMLDRDLAKLYGGETKRMKEAVKRNKGRFPEDFIFEMTNIEFKNWRTQFATSNLSDRMGLRHLPFCFTEQGVAMLSSVLNSERAINVNIQIIRIFTKIRQMLADTTELHLEIEQIKKKLNNNTQNIEVVFRYLDELIEGKNKPIKKEKPRESVGYRTNN